MNLNTALSLNTLKELIGPCKIVGSTDNLISGINEIHKVRPGDLTFVDHPKYYKSTLNSAATVIIIDQEYDCPMGKTLIIHPEPFKTYNSLVNHFFDFRPMASPLQFDQYPDLIAEPNVMIGHNVTIGKNCYFQAGVYIGNDSVIGDNVIIQAGTIIGTDAFYYKKENGSYTKWTSCGRVIIEDDVCIGAGCTINRGVSGDTIIGAGTKIDCQVHVAHGVVIGKNCLIVAQVGIAGKTIIEDDVTIYGQSAIAPNLYIGKGAIVQGKSGVTKNLEGGKTYFGIPAIEARQKMKELATLRRITK